MCIWRWHEETDVADCAPPIVIKGIHRDMSAPVQFLDVIGTNTIRKIAYIKSETGHPGAPGVFWLSGFQSDMTSTKASVLAPWTTGKNAGFLRFDYSGHGQSGGRLPDFTIGEWLEESVAAFLQLTTGPQIIVGSSMGGWLALLLVRALRRSHPVDAARIKALVLIAPAWDMTEELMWKQFTPEIRGGLERNGVYQLPTEYGEPYPITYRLIDEGRAHLLGSGFDPGCPVRILQGMGDKDVPWRHSLRLVELLGNNDVRLLLVKDGEHRMSRAPDLALLFGAIEEFLG
jgi:pimeloyl-ACP methyl ester carboxylesterase